MKVDEIITLQNKEKYLLLLNTVLTKENYFLSVLLDENYQPTEKYEVLKEVLIDNHPCVIKIKNPELLENLIADYRLQYDDEYEN